MVAEEEAASDKEPDPAEDEDQSDDDPWPEDDLFPDYSTDEQESFGIRIVTAGEEPPSCEILQPTELQLRLCHKHRSEPSEPRQLSRFFTQSRRLLRNSFWDWTP